MTPRRRDAHPLPFGSGNLRFDLKPVRSVAGCRAPRRIAAEHPFPAAVGAPI
jgi:hypothetical protein